MRAIWFAVFLLFATAAEGRPLTIEDVLRGESYGQVQIDPTERWAIVERRNRYDSAPRFDYGVFVDRAVTRLMVLDLAAPGRLVPLFEQAADAGYWSGGFSPSGRSLAVFRLQNDRLTLGVLDMATRTVRWLAIPPALPTYNPNPHWLDDDAILYVARPDGRLPVTFEGAGFLARQQTERWARRAQGREPSVTVLGSGEYRNEGLDNEGNALVLARLQTGEEEILERGSIADVALSGDRRQIAVVERGPALQPVPERLVDPAERGRRQRLIIRNLVTGARREICPACDILPNLLQWSPSGAHLLYFARRDGETWEQGQLFRYDDGRVEAVSIQGARPEVRNVQGDGYTVNASWAGLTPVAWTRSAGGGAGRWLRAGRRVEPVIGERPSALLAVSPRNAYAVAGTNLVRQQSAGAPRVVLAGDALSTGVSLLAPHAIGSRPIYNPSLDEIPPVGVTRNGVMSVVRIERETGRPRWSVLLPSPEIEVLAAGRRRAAVIYRRVDRAGAATLMLAQDGGALVLLDETNTHLRDTDPPERLAVHSTSRTGSRLTHWLTLPPRGAGPAPLVVLPYPGIVYSDARPPEGESWTMRPILNPRLLAAAGFAVLEPSLPRERPEGDYAASTVDLGPSDPERAATYDPIGEMTQTVLGAVDAAAATGRIDGGRVALYGHSFGGFAVMAIASRTDRLSAVVASAGSFDFATGYGRLAPVNEVDQTGVLPIIPFGYFERGQASIGGAPWAFPERYRSRSPFYAVDRIRTPALIIHGDLDFVPYEGAERMFMGLFRLDRDAIFLRYAGEGHMPTSPANLRDYWQRLDAFLTDRFAREPRSQSRQ